MWSSRKPALTGSDRFNEARCQRDRPRKALPARPINPKAPRENHMRNKNSADRRREDQRNELWPGSTEWIWDPSDEENVGFATMSRLMPWIMVLIRHLAGKGKDPTGPYWEMWCRDMGQSIIQINDEQECAYASGYTSSRALRTWREHMHLLAELYFLKIERAGNREVGYVLLMNPLKVARWYHEQGKAPEGWWSSFSNRAREIKADVSQSLNPTATVRKPKSAPATV